MKNFTGRELAKKMEVPFDTFKRWVREFLPPDSESGRQKGKARLFCTSEAYKIFLAKHLVGRLKLTIEESRQVLKDIWQWLMQNNLHPQAARLPGYDACRIEIKRCSEPMGFFSYEAINIIEKYKLDEQGLKRIFKDIYNMEKIMVPEVGNVEIVSSYHLMIIPVSELLNKFHSEFCGADARMSENSQEIK